MRGKAAVKKNRYESDMTRNRIEAKGSHAEPGPSRARGIRSVVSGKESGEGKKSGEGERTRDRKRSGGEE